MTDKIDLPYTEDEEIIKQIQDDAFEYFSECQKYSMHIAKGEPILNDKSVKDFKTKTYIFALYEKYINHQCKYKNIIVEDAFLNTNNKNGSYHSFHKKPGGITLSVNAGKYTIYQIYYMNGEQFNMYGPSYIIDNNEYYYIGSKSLACAKHMVDEFQKLNDINNVQTERIKELESNNNNEKVKELETILSAQNIVLVDKDKLIEKLQNELDAQNNVLAELKKDETPQLKSIIEFDMIETKLATYKFYYDSITKLVSKIEINKGDKLSEYIPISLHYDNRKGGYAMLNGVYLYFKNGKLHNCGKSPAVIHADGDEEYWYEGTNYGVIEKSKLK